MKLDKAIEILTQTSKEPNIRLDNDEIDAIKLGIEALTYIIRLRAFSLQARQEKLPSEVS